VRVLHGNIQSHKNYSRWAFKYQLNILDEKRWLTRRANSIKRKKASGRHVTKLRKQQEQINSSTVAEQPQISLSSVTAAAATASSSGPAPMMIDSSSSSSSDEDEPAAVPQPASPDSSTTGVAAMRSVQLGPIGRAYPVDLTPYDTFKRVARVSELEGIMEKHHNGPHQGINGLHQSISMEYIGISRDLCIAYQKRCVRCKEKFNSSAPPPPVLHAIPTDRYLNHAQTDCLSFVDKRTGIRILRVILNYVCIATKLHEFVLIKDKTFPNMKTAFWQVFARTGGPPDLIQSDNGGEFICAALVKWWQSVCYINVRNGREYRPQTQGVVERSNRVLRRLLNLMCTDPSGKYLKWDFKDILLQAQYWMNCYIHRSTHQSAFFTVYGRIPRVMENVTPLDGESKDSLMQDLLELDEDDDEDEDDEDVLVSDDLAEIASQREQRGAAAAANHERYQQQWLAAANAGLKDNTYDAGDVVLMRPVSNTSNKSLVRQIDRQKVLILAASAYSKYQIYTEYGKLKQLIHANHLEPLAAGVPIPESLQIPAQDYKTLKNGKGITMTKYIKRLFETEWRYQQAQVHLSLHTSHEEFDPVLKIKRQKVIKNPNV
jgi:hypothetical protein